MKLVVVAGRPRSGGAAVAELLHTLGVPMGTCFFAPAPPSYRCEWEDRDLCSILEKCNEIAREDPEAAARAACSSFAGYLRARVASARTLADVTDTACQAIGIKTPLLLPYLPSLWLAAADSELSPLLVRSVRSEVECLSSVRRCNPHDLGEAMTMYARCKHLESRHRYAVEVEYEPLVRWPAVVVEKLVRDLGLKVDEERVADAASRIRRLEPEVV